MILNKGDEAMNQQPEFKTSGAWTTAEVESDRSWIYRMNGDEASELLAVVREGMKADKPLLAYTRSDFPLRPMQCLTEAFEEASQRRGIALIAGLPRVGVSEQEFSMLTWAIGLNFGVARPQSRMSEYITQVKNVGGQYRNATGRGYSSNAELDFHIDGGDLVLLSCYNQAPIGGMSLCTSSTKAYQVMLQERPDLARILTQPFPFSRNGEESVDETPWYLCPIFAVEDGRVFCMWNRNRVMNTQQLEGAPQLSGKKHEAMDYLDKLVRRPELMFCMHLEPGDLQLMNNHTALHSRTSFEDFPDEARLRTLYRIWLATPDSCKLPESWIPFWKSTEPSSVRGGIRGHKYDDTCRRFDRDQAAAVGMRPPS